MITINNKYGIRYYEAMVAKYEARIMEAEANLDMYFHNMAAIGEHSDLQEEFEKWIAVVADTQGKLDVLKNNFVLGVSPVNG
jgi:hypothetical protein